MSKKDQKIKALKKEVKKLKAQVKKLKTHALSKKKKKQRTTNRNERKTVALVTTKAEEPQGRAEDATLMSVDVAAVR